MPKPTPSFKTSGLRTRRSPRVKTQNGPENFNLPKALKKIEILKNPIQSESDKKEYKVIRLPNGLRALLISDLNSLKSKCFDAGPLAVPTEDEIDEDQFVSGCESSSEADSDGSHSDMDDDDESEEGDEDEISDDSDAGMRYDNKGSEGGDEKMAACALSVGVGSFSDPRHIQGMAHFVEHMVFMGSKKYPKENDFDSFIKKKGGSDNASTDCEITTFYFEIQENCLEEAMDRFSQFFVSPLMKQEAMQREREAIQSEFALAIPSDSNRRDQLLMGFLPAGHPAHTFMWGDARSLAAPMGPEDPELHRAAHDFRRRHYSAHRMTVTVQARLPLETLEKYVVSTFGMIPTNEQPPDDFSAHLFKPEDLTPEFHSLYYVKPVNQITELTLTWCMRSFLQDYKSKPHQYVSWILGHEGAGSLLSYLRKRVWALGIYTGNSESGIDHTSVLCFFTITIVLTVDGLKNKEEVLDAVFSYINMLGEQCPSERIFKEIQSIEETNFRFDEESQPCENVENLVESMHYYPPEHYLTGPDLFYEYKPEDITYVLECMVPDKVNIMILSQDHSVPIEYNQVEEWFGTEYMKTNIPVESVERWKEIKPYDEFHLPEPNIYITDNFDLVPMPSELMQLVAALESKTDPAAAEPADSATDEKAEKTKSKRSVCAKTKCSKNVKNKPCNLETCGNISPDSSVLDDEKKAVSDRVKAMLDAPPALLINDGLIELWFKQDYKFRLPNAYICIHFISPLSLKSEKDSCLLDVWCSVLRQLLTEKLYAADMAGLSHSLYTVDRGLVLKLNGFSQKLPILVDVITKTMKDYSVSLSEELFNAIIDVQAKSYHNYILKPTKLVKDVRFSLILEKHFTHLQKLGVLRNITYDDAKTIGEQFSEQLHVQMLVQGNLVKEDALAIAETVKNNLNWRPLTGEHRPTVRVYEIPEGSKCCRVQSLNETSGNSNITNYYQSGPYTLKESCIIELIMMLMEEPLFDTLRTKEQLGYSVFCLLRYTFGVLGYSVTVNTQVEKFSVDHVDERIESFLESFGGDMKELSKKMFQQTRQALIKLKRCVDVELKDEVLRNWGEISSMEYSFDRLAQEIKCLKEITIEDVQSWFDQHSLSGSNTNFKKLSLQIVGNKKEETSSAEDDAAPISPDASTVHQDEKHLLKFLEAKVSGEGTDKPLEFITNVEEFKKNLKLYPEMRHEIPNTPCH